MKTFFLYIYFSAFLYLHKTTAEISYLKVKQNSCIKKKGPSIILNSVNADCVVQKG
jgi:hypothetical protein